MVEISGLAPLWMNNGIDYVAQEGFLREVTFKLTADDNTKLEKSWGKSIPVRGFSDVLREQEEDG